MMIGKLAACVVAGGCMMVGVAAADEMGEASFALPRDVVTAAAVFQQYMTSAAHIDGGFSNGESVLRGLKTSVAYQPAQLEEGMIAYGALAALQDDRFVAGVQQAAGRGEQRAAFAERLIEDPYAATHIDGAGEAVQRVEAALSAKAAPLMSAATTVKAAAYSVQHQAWSKIFVPNAQSRLADVKSLSSQPTAASEAQQASMMQEMGGLQPAVATSAAAPAGYTAIEARALALAAESVLGHAQGDDRDRLSPILTESETAECFKMAKLNLYQCMAVAGPQYEDIFCMGQHAMMDTGTCVASAAHSVAAPITGLASLPPRPSANQTTYVALASHRSLQPSGR
jgi:hypothetical protein